MTFLRDTDRPPGVAPVGVALVALLLLTAFPFPLPVFFEAGGTARSRLAEGGAEPFALLLWHGLVVGILLAVLLLPRAVGARQGVPAPGPSRGFALFALTVLIEALFVPYGFAAWLLLLELAAFAAVAWLAARCGPGLLRWIAWPLAVAAAAQGLLVVWQRVFAGVDRPAGTFLNPNHLAAWIVAVLLLAWGQALATGRTSSRNLWLRGAGTVPALAGLALTGSRGALLGLVVGGIALGATVWPRLAPAARRGLLGAAGALAVVAATVVVARLSDWDPFRYHRLRIWSASFAIFLDAPWTGSGPGQFATAARNFQFPDGAEPLRYDKSFSSPHSDLVRLPSEFGWPGTLAMFAALALAARELAARARAAELPRGWQATVAALSALAAHALVDDLSHRPALYLLVATLAGSLLARPAPASATVPGRAARLALGLLLGAAFVAGDLAPYLAWEHSRGLPHGRLQEQDSRRLQRALERNPLHPELWLRKAEHLAGKGDDWDLDRYAEAREATERAIRLQPAGATYRRGLGRIEALACRTLFQDRESRERAEDAYRKAQSLARFDPFLPLELGAFLLDTGDPAGARRQAERALALEPEAVAPRLLLADALLEGAGAIETDRARALLAEAHELAARWKRPQWETAYEQELLRLAPDLAARIERKVDAFAAEALPAR